MKKLGIGLLVIVLLLGAGVYYVLTNLNSIVKSAIETYGSEATKASVRLDKVDLKLDTGEGTLDGLHVGNPQGFTTPEALTFGAIRVKLDTKSLAGSGPIVIREIAIDNPRVTYEHTPSGSNLEALQKNAMAFAGGSNAPAAGSSSGKSADSGRKIIIDNLYVRNGEIAITDTRLPGKALSATLPAVHLANVGKASGGVPPAEVTKQLLAALTSAASLVAAHELQSEIGGLAGGAVQGNMGGGLKKLFGN